MYIFVCLYVIILIIKNKSIMETGHRDEIAWPAKCL